MKPSSTLTVDSLFDEDSERNIASDLSVSSEFPEYFKYAFHLKVTNHDVEPKIEKLQKIHERWYKLFSSYPDISACSEPILMTEHAEEPYKRIRRYPYKNNLNIFDFDGWLIVKFNAEFRDARALCRFLSAMFNALENKFMAMSFIVYEDNSDVEKHRVAYMRPTMTYYLNAAFRHKNIYINAGEMNKNYVNIYKELNEVCSYMFKDKFQTYRRLKSVFDGTEPPSYLYNVTTAINRHMYPNSSRLFTTSEFSKALKNVEIDFTKIKSLDNYSYEIFICPLMDIGCSDYPLNHPSIDYALREITGWTMCGRVEHIHVYQSNSNSNVYALAVCIGAYIDNDYNRTLRHLILTIRGEMKRKSNTFAKNITALFGDDCRKEINSYMQFLKKDCNGRR